ncbi:MAG TPA: hypothetical protein VLG50_03670 [Candidatus Saccharimonadales bacterium]|nr:hypothetical protein [Candidatus Saccharimonadales bacterium]
MEKTLVIDDKDIRFKTNGAIPLRYKAQFGRDYFKDILKMLPASKAKKKKNEEAYDVKDLETLDFEVFYNIAWVLAKTGNPEIPDPITWFSEFEEFPIGDIFPELQDLMIATLSSTKKKL